MSDNAFFARFRANTLKWMLKWIQNPNNSQTASTLQKYIPMDRDKKIMASRKTSNAVKLQLIEIEKQSPTIKQFMRQIVQNTSNLKNSAFIQNVANASKSNTVRQHTIIKNHTNKGINEMTTPLMESYNETERILNDLQQRTIANTQKLRLLNELSATMPSAANGKETIINELANNKEQQIGWKFRKEILTLVIHRIKKKERKLLQSKKSISLQMMMEKITLSKNKSLCQSTLKLNTINMELDKIKRDLMILCSNTNTNNMEKIYGLQSKKKEKEIEKKSISDKIKTQNVVIKGCGLLINEIINHKTINTNEWASLSMNVDVNLVSNVSDLKQRQTHSVHTLPNVPVKKVTKRKFKRPTRSNVVKAKTLSVCDILPQKIFPLKLSDKWSSIFCADTTQRDEWIDEYNAKHIPAIQKKYSSIYGDNIYFKEMKKHRITTVNKENQENQDDECINASEDDDNVSSTHSQTNTEPHVLSFPSLDFEEAQSNTKRMNKQSLNLNKQSLNQKRYKVKYNTQKKAINVDKNHPLLMNDPMKRIKSMNRAKETFGDGLCLHFVARGMCKYLNKGCEYKHPQQYNADKFYCITLNKNGECTRNDCKYTHNLKDIPCKDYHEGKCLRLECLRSHTFTMNKYNIWCNAKKARYEAYGKWMDINNKNRNDNYNAENVRMNESVKNDDRLNNVATNQLFESALIE